VMCRLQHSDYPPNPRVVAEARLWLARLLARWDLTDVTDAAGLLLTELVTNAVVHARSQVHVVAAVADGMVEVGVADQAPASRLPGLPDLTLGRPHEDSLAGVPERGRGLALVAHLADAWGVADLGQGKQVWFQLPVGQSWTYRSDCTCADESNPRIRLGSGRFAVAMPGPWDQPPHGHRFE